MCFTNSYYCLTYVLFPTTKVRHWARKEISWISRSQRSNRNHMIYRRAWRHLQHTSRTYRLHTFRMYHQRQTRLHTFHSCWAGMRCRCTSLTIIPSRCRMYQYRIACRRQRWPNCNLCRLSSIRITFSPPTISTMRAQGTFYISCNFKVMRLQPTAVRSTWMTYPTICSTATVCSISNQINT